MSRVHDALRVLYAQHGPALLAYAEASPPIGAGAEDIVQRHAWAPGAMLRNCWRTNVQCQPGLSTSYVTFSSTPPEPSVPDQSRLTTTTTQSRQSTAALIRQFCSTPCNHSS